MLSVLGGPTCRCVKGVLSKSMAAAASVIARIQQNQFTASNSPISLSLFTVKISVILRFLGPFGHSESSHDQAQTQTNSHHVSSNSSSKLAEAQALPIRGHIQSLHVNANREVHLQYAIPSSYSLKAPLTQIPDSFIFLFFSMILIACSLYLPHHIAFLITRAFFYYQGDAIAAADPAIVEAALEHGREALSTAVRASASSAGDKLREVVHTVVANAAHGAESIGKEL